MLFTPPRVEVLVGFPELLSESAFLGEAPAFGVTDRNRLSVFKPPRMGLPLNCLPIIFSNTVRASSSLSICTNQTSLMSLLTLLTLALYSWNSATTSSFGMSDERSRKIIVFLSNVMSGFTMVWSAFSLTSLLGSCFDNNLQVFSKGSYLWETGDYVHRNVQGRVHLLYEVCVVHGLLLDK